MTSIETRTLRTAHSAISAERQALEEKRTRGEGLTLAEVQREEELRAASQWIYCRIVRGQFCGGCSHAQFCGGMGLPPEARD